MLGSNASSTGSRKNRSAGSSNSRCPWVVVPSSQFLNRESRSVASAWLNGLLDFPAADAAGAHEQASRGAVHERPDGLQVRTEDALGAVVGVADVVAD